jgi:malonate decarboxylase alpha subunit
VIAQVNEIVDTCRASTSRPTGSTSWCRRRRPHYIEPLFTRDPAQISEIQVLMAMMAIKGIYAEYGVAAPEPRHRLRHRRHRTAAADLCESLGLKGKIGRTGR